MHPLFETSLLAALGSGFALRVPCQPLPEVHWVARNAALAAELGLAPDWLHSDAALALLAGNHEHAAEFHASVYSGHQFGHWAGQLGDGRALSLGQINTANSPSDAHEVQLKGAGRTPYSRGADGRAVLRSTIREYLASEAMHALGIPSTRALAIVGSPATVLREQAETAAVLTRTAPSFVRFGHFEHFAAYAAHKGDTVPLQTLFNSVLQRYYPECVAAPQPVAAFLAQVVQRSAALVAAWQAVGFCHGVMNTDNMSILGLTLDYGPYQWMDGFDPEHICNHSDTQGRYRYSQQPAIMRWNLFCLGQALMPLLPADLGQEAAAGLLIGELERFGEHYATAWQSKMAAKLGLPELKAEGLALLQQLLALLAAERVDWTIFWRRWAQALHPWAEDSTEPAFTPVRDLFAQREAFDAWLLSFEELLRQVYRPQSDKTPLKTALQHNPAYVLRNHLAQEAIAAAEGGDFAPTERLAQVLAQPYTEQAGYQHYSDFAPDWAAGISVSCSS